MVDASLLQLEQTGETEQDPERANEKGDPLVQDFGSGVIFRDSAGTASGMAYLFFGSTRTFVHASY